MKAPRETATDRKARADADRRWREEQARIAREAPAHLVWSDPVVPDVPPPTTGYTEGWTFRVSLGSYSQSVTVHRAWSEPCAHGDGLYPGRDRARSASQHSIALYSSEALAWQAARAEVCRQAAVVLLYVDERAEKASP